LKLVPGFPDQMERKYLVRANKYSVEKDPYKREQEKKDDRKFKKRSAKIHRCSWVRYYDEAGPFVCLIVSIG
ncbi:MAG: hypothetical protein ACREBU_14900, partial [Nitrososphaera sp.]